MKRLNKWLVISLSVLVLGSMSFHAMANSDSADLTTTDKEVETGVVVGRYGYAYASNFSNSGAGKIRLKFLTYDSGTWTTVYNTTIPENAWDESNSVGSTSGTIYYNMKANLSTVWNPDYGFYGREGITIVTGLYP